MTTINMFEQASIQKFRFDSPKGLLNVEDLWSLPLVSGSGKANLDDIAKGLHRQLKNSDDVSFVTPSSKTDKSLQMKFDIVKYIIDVIVAENAAANDASARADKKQQILRIIANKETEELASASIEDLKKLADSM